MSSAVSDFKHAAQDGYFITTGAAGTSNSVVGYYLSTAGSGAGGSFVQPVMTPLSGGVATALALAGTVLRDMGKTVTVGGIANSASAGSTAGTVGVPTRVFRKVQLINTPSRVVGDAANVANGVGGVASDAATGNIYQTFYLELPTLGRSGGLTNLLGQAFVYIPALPGLYV